MENAAEAYVAYRKQIEHEDDLIGLRIGWFIAAEGLLFAAYGVVFRLRPSHSEVPYQSTVAYSPSFRFSES